MHDINIILDQSKTAYRGLFSDDWPKRILEQSQSAPKLDRLLFDLIMQWRGAAYTAEFPAAMVDHFSIFAEQFVQNAQPHLSGLKLATVLVQRCNAEISEVASDTKLQNELQALFTRLGDELVAANATDLRFPSEAVWQRYINEHAFRHTLWSSLRICFVEIYNAYDNFIRRCVQIGSGKSTIGNSTRDFRKHFSATFGESLREQCWESDDLKLIRYVRHSLSHAGGRNTRKIEELNQQQFHILDDYIQIRPTNLRTQYEVLKQNVTTLVETACSWPQFAHDDSEKPRRSGPGPTGI